MDILAKMQEKNEQFEQLKAGVISEEAGQAKYRAYFVNTHIYARFQEAVNSILEIDGYDFCIVTE